MCVCVCVCVSVCVCVCVCVYVLIVIVIVNSKFLKRHSKPMRRALAYSRPLHQIRGVYQRIVRERHRSGCHMVRGCVKSEGGCVKSDGCVYCVCTRVRARICHTVFACLVVYTIMSGRLTVTLLINSACPTGLTNFRHYLTLATAVTNI